MITATLHRAWNDISGFIIVMTIMLLAYSIAVRNVDVCFLSSEKHRLGLHNKTHCLFLHVFVQFKCVFSQHALNIPFIWLKCITNYKKCHIFKVSWYKQKKMNALVAYICNTVQLISLWSSSLRVKKSRIKDLKDREREREMFFKKAEYRW